MAWWTKKSPERLVVEADTVSIPTMLRSDMVKVIESGEGGPSLAMLVYTEQSYEIVSGTWSLFIDMSGTRTYWVGDRCVAIEGLDGVLEPVPSLVHLQVGTTVSAARLVNERLRAA